mmetsp:Transcript_30207/g.69686  ORF Transcript_30207/g.69686 Transcript_30207/m.69686 type:complete len:81 (-) Transcript_30207:141-383(-)
MFLLLISFSRETPHRFRKELFKAVPKESGDAIQVDTMNQILVNIGRPGDLLTEEEWNLLLKDAGSSDNRSIPVEKMMQLM